MAGIASPQQASTVSGELLVYGNAEVPAGGRAKVEVRQRQDRDWRFVGEVYSTQRGGLLGRITPPYFSSLPSGLMLVRVVVVDRAGQEIYKCQVSVTVAN
jgi:hypothetical protein